MPEIEHNGPGLMYIVMWHQVSDPDSYNDYGNIWIDDWKQDRFVILELPGSTLYNIQVGAKNDEGYCEGEISAVRVMSGNSLQSLSGSRQFYHFQLGLKSKTEFNFNYCAEFGFQFIIQILITQIGGPAQFACQNWFYSFNF